MRLNVCVNEMVPYSVRPFAAIIKSCSTYNRDGTKRVLRTRRDG